MHPSVNLLAPLLALLSGVGAVEVPREPAPMADREGAVTVRLVVASEAISRPATSPVLPVQSMTDPARIDLPQQVSIQQQVTIRVVPRPAPPALPAAMFATEADASGPRFVERKFGKCLPMSGIVGVHPVSSRKLLLIMRDDRLFTAELKKGCQARDYYSGFLVAKSDDGMICKERDKLRARSGATCEVSGFRQIIELGV